MRRPVHRRIRTALRMCRCSSSDCRIRPRTPSCNRRNGMQPLLQLQGLGLAEIRCRWPRTGPDGKFHSRDNRHRGPPVSSACSHLRQAAENASSWASLMRLAASLPHMLSSSPHHLEHFDHLDEARHTHEGAANAASSPAVLTQQVDAGLRGPARARDPETGAQPHLVKTRAIFELAGQNGLFERFADAICGSFAHGEGEHKPYYRASNKAILVYNRIDSCTQSRSLQSLTSFVSQRIQHEKTSGQLTSRIGRTT